MTFQHNSFFGFAKLTKFKDAHRLVEMPTIMTNLSQPAESFWRIGDDKDFFTMNFPPNCINPMIEPNFEGNFFIANFLMQRTIHETILKKELQKTRKRISGQFEQFLPERVIALIQPTSSEEFLKEVLQTINDFGISNVAINNLSPLLTNHRQMTRFLGLIRTTLPIDAIIYLISPVPHTIMPILVYAGVDIFSDGFANIASSQDLFLTDTGGMPLKELKEKICFCEVCAKVEKPEQLLHVPKEKTISKEGEERAKSLLYKHNQWIFLKKIREIRHAIKTKSLRGYIEQSIQSNVFSAAALRLLDKEWIDWLILRTPTWLAAPLYSITPYSYGRPAVKEFQKRILNRFIIEDFKRVIVILPCSARKPYSKSRSHELYLRTQDELDWSKRAYIQELILTSPLGVVPRELEDIYPAAHYDVPVTGEWDFEEKQTAIKQLFGVLSKVNSSNGTIIAHVDNEYIELCEEVEKKLGKKIIYSAKDERSTSQKALSNLLDELRKAVEDLPPVNFSSDTNKLQKIADYQFGSGVGKALFPDKCRIKGHPPLPLKVLSKGEQLGVIHPSSGQLTLSIKTGQALAVLKKYFVIFNGEKLEGSTLFAVGVEDADPAIRPTDSVVIINKDHNVVGVGEAIVSGKDILSLKRGAVVKIKQKIKEKARGVTLVE